MYSVPSNKLLAFEHSRQVGSIPCSLNSVHLFPLLIRELWLHVSTRIFRKLFCQNPREKEFRFSAVSNKKFCLLAKLEGNQKFWVLLCFLKWLPPASEIKENRSMSAKCPFSGNCFGKQRDLVSEMRVSLLPGDQVILLRRLIN